MVDILSVKPVHQGWSRFSLVTFRLDDGTVLTREIEDHGSAAVVLPYDPKRRMALLVNQFRGPVRMAQAPGFPEPPAGIIEDGEDPAETARREALEETGYRLGELEPVGCYWSSPGVTTERSWLFLSAYEPTDRVADGGGVDEHERIEVIETPLSELDARLERGELADLKMLALVQALKLRRPELF
jgi:nudix-type nucleoside diphosphatase (YffH/AdpP family)